MSIPLQGICLTKPHPPVMTVLCQVPLTPLLSNPQHCCHQYLDTDTYRTLISEDTRQRLTVKDMAILCITLASWNPEATRGMQVLVFLDHMMPLVLPSLGVEGLKFVTDAMQFLIKGCEGISK